LCAPWRWSDIVRDLLDEYAGVAGASMVDHLRQLARPLSGLQVVHVNSTREGGGVAEILHKLVPLMQALGLEVSWEIIGGDLDFYRCTKTFHNALQGNQLVPTAQQFAAYEGANKSFADQHCAALRRADMVFVHDPQPAPVLNFCAPRQGKWIWRCHIDVSRPYRPVWKYMRGWVEPYDASIFSLPQFSRRLSHPQYIVPPSIDPLSQKNEELPQAEAVAIRERFGLDENRPLIVQVSRFDRFKDPIGVIEAYRLVKRFTAVQLVLAGGGATDDPEGEVVLEEVRQAAADDPDIHILVLPPDAHRTINALQRAADIVLQKSVREGFGLTVSEAMWKHKPVIGGDVGGIRLQVVNDYTGFLVSTPEGAALRIRYLLHRRSKLAEMGERAHRHVRENFLVTRHLRDYLALMIGLLKGSGDRIDVGKHA
jgi:trehalose synthase